MAGYLQCAANMWISDVESKFWNTWIWGGMWSPNWFPGIMYGTWNLPLMPGNNLSFNISNQHTGLWMDTQWRVQGTWWSTEIHTPHRSLVCGPNDVRCGGEIGTREAHPNLRRWEMLGGFPRINCRGGVLQYAVSHWAVCKTAWLQRQVGNLQFINKGLAMSLIIMDLVKPFWVWTYGTECWTSIPRAMRVNEATWGEFCNLVHANW
jgi:hypothetical protein